jgi:hypothetical protein
MLGSAYTGRTAGWCARPATADEGDDLVKAHVTRLQDAEKYSLLIKGNVIN